MTNEKIFADGMIVKRREKAPEYILCNLSIKVDEFIAFLQRNQSNGWVNIDCAVGKTGKHYASLDTWKPTQGDAARAGISKAREALTPPVAESFADDDIPF